MRKLAERVIRLLALRIVRPIAVVSLLSCGSPSLPDDHGIKTALLGGPGTVQPMCQAGCIPPEEGSDPNPTAPGVWLGEYLDAAV